MATMDIQRMMLEGQLDEVKKGNPWDVYSIFEFNFFCCPECDCKTQSKQDFINHASTLHPWVSVKWAQYPYISIFHVWIPFLKCDRFKV